MVSKVDGMTIETTLNPYPYGYSIRKATFTFGSLRYVATQIQRRWDYYGHEVWEGVELYAEKAQDGWADTWIGYANLLIGDAVHGPAARYALRCFRDVRY